MAWEGLEDLRLHWPAAVTVGAWLAGFPCLSSMELVCEVELLFTVALEQVPALRSLELEGACTSLASLPTDLTNLQLNNCTLEVLP